jgi:hypothetical protein
VGPGLGEGIGVDEEAERGVASGSAQTSDTQRCAPQTFVATMNARKGAPARYRLARRVSHKAPTSPLELL